MHKQQVFVLVVLGAALLLVAALVGVLTLGGSTSLEAEGTRLPGPRGVATGDADLPVPIEGTHPGPIGPPAPLRPTGPTLVGPYIIIGRVLDDETGAPVDSYTVKVMRHADRPPLERLDEEPGNPQPMHAVAGIFRVERGKGRWDVVVQAASYLPGTLVDVEIPRPDAQPLELRLSHGPSITGIVYDEHNLGLQDVPVFLHVTRLSGPDPPPRVSVARTDAAGRFRFSPLPAGLYAVSALEPDSDDRMRDIALEGGTAEVAVFVAPRQQMVAAVRDPWGRPVRDARVELRSPSSIASEATNAAGQAQLRFLKPGRYDVRVTREGYVELTEPLVIEGAAGEIVRWYTLQPTE